MKPIRFLIASALLTATTAFAQAPLYQIGVDGLACPFCAYGIEKQLLKLDGVQSLEVDIANSTIVITMKEGRVLQRDQVEQAVKKAGFSLRSFDPVQKTIP